MTCACDLIPCSFCGMPVEADPDETATVACEPCERASGRVSDRVSAIVAARRSAAEHAFRAYGRLPASRPAPLVRDLQEAFAL